MPLSVSQRASLHFLSVLFSVEVRCASTTDNDSEDILLQFRIKPSGSLPLYHGLFVAWFIVVAWFVLLHGLLLHGLLSQHGAVVGWHMMHEN